MTLQQWQSNGWLTPEPTSSQEIHNLLAIVDRDLRDAAGPLSADWKFGIAYNAALKLCSVLLRANGYRATRGLQHYRTIMAMPLILGKNLQGDATYLDSCRKKRNSVEYDAVGGVSDGEAQELIEFVPELKARVTNWLMDHHPQLLAGEPGG